MSDHHHGHDHHSGGAASSWSLLRASVLDRLVVAAGIMILMWAGVWWAFQ